MRGLFGAVLVGHRFRPREFNRQVNGAVALWGRAGRPEVSVPGVQPPGNKCMGCGAGPVGQEIRSWEFNRQVTSAGVLDGAGQAEFHVPGGQPSGKPMQGGGPVRASPPGHGSTVR